jgi:hypothetical protein
MITQTFGEEKRAVHGQFKLTETEKVEAGEDQRQEHAHHFL